MSICKTSFITTLLLAALSLSACAGGSAQTSALTPVTMIDPILYKDFSSQQQTAYQACGVDETEFYRLMALDYRAFDQDFEGGWRAIDYQDGCRPIAGEILEHYIAYSSARRAENLKTLKWHTGQMLAGNGDYAKALTYFEQTYKSHENQADWNLYVDGTIAFLNRDRAVLQAARDTLAALPVPDAVKDARRKFLEDNPNITMPEGFIDSPANLTVLDDFLTCFDEPYSVAYGKCGD